LGELAGGARDGEAREARERDDARARAPGQAQNANEEREELDVPECHAVPDMRKGFE
jgi:hypothetical protein